MQTLTIFRNVMKIKELSGDVQVIPQIDAEIAEKGHFWMETK